MDRVSWEKPSEKNPILGNPKICEQHTCLSLKHNNNWCTLSIIIYIISIYPYIIIACASCSSYKQGYIPYIPEPLSSYLPQGRSMTWKTLTIKIHTDTNNTYNYTGKTKVALVELPTVNMFGFFFCAPFPSRILAWSLSYPGCISALQKLKKLICLKQGDN